MLQQIKMKIDLTKEQIQSLINLLEGSSVPIPQAQNALDVLNKLKEAKD